MRWLSLVATLALLAGCLEEQAPPVTADVEPDEEPGRTARQGGYPGGFDEGEQEEKRSGDVTLRSYSKQFDLSLTSASAFLRLGSSIQGHSCVAVDGAPYTILNGTVTFTWTSQSPLTDSLDAEIRSYYSNKAAEVHSGASPLVVQFEDFEIEKDDVLTFGILVAQPAGAAYEQDVTMVLAFDYKSDLDVEVSPGYC